MEVQLFSLICVWLCVLDGAQKFTPAQEQQLVRSYPRDRPMCQHKQKQVHSSEVTCLIPVTEEIHPESFSVCLAWRYQSLWV